MNRILTSVLILLVLTVLLITGGCSSSSSPAKNTSLITVTIGSSSKTVSLAICPATLVARTELQLRKVWRSGLAIAAGVPVDVKSIKITVSAADMTTISRSIEVLSQLSITDSFEVPNGTGRLFKVEALNSGVVVTYSSQAILDLNGNAVELPFEMHVVTQPTETGAKIFSSTDGSNWTVDSAMSTTAATPSYCVAYGGGQFVSVRGFTNFSGSANNVNTKAVATSPDGVMWTSRSIPATALATGAQSLDFRSLTYGGGQFVAVGASYFKSTSTSTGHNEAAILTSPDGIIWTNRALPADWTGSNTTNSYLGDVTYGGGQFVAVGYNFGAGNILRASVLTSPDGSAWTSRSLPSDYYSLLNSVAYNGGLFVAVGEYTFNYSIAGQHDDGILTSPDGITWTRRTLPDRTADSYSYLRSVTYGGGQFVAVGTRLNPTAATSTEAVILTSLDGISWTSRTSPVVIPANTSLSFTRVVNGGGQYVAVGNVFNTSTSGSANQSGFIISSTDGITWTNRTLPGLPSNTLFGVYDATYGAGKFLMPGYYYIPVVQLTKQLWSKE
jgi:hypothetical protein